MSAAAAAKGAAKVVAGAGKAGAAAASAAASAAGKAGAPKPPTEKMPDNEAAAAIGYPTAAACLAALAPLNAAVASEVAVYATLRPAFPMTLHPTTGTLTPAGPLPDRPPPGGPRLLRKRLRMYPYWKHRPARRWADFAPLVKELHVTYDPALEGARGARELGLQARTAAMRKKFPGAVVRVVEVEDGSLTVVMIKWVRCFVF